MALVIRSCGLLAALLVLLVPAGAGARPRDITPPPGIVIVGNLRDGTVTFVDQNRLNVLGTLNVIPDGSTPRDPGRRSSIPASSPARA